LKGRNPNPLKPPTQIGKAAAEFHGVFSFLLCEGILHKQHPRQQAEQWTNFLENFIMHGLNFAFTKQLAER
jgi:hypothetical protein